MFHSIKISYKNKVKYIPQCWELLSSKQFLEVFKIFSKKIIIEEQKILLVKNLLSINWKLFKQLTEDQLLDLLPITDFIYSEEEIKLNKNPLPKFKLKNTTYYGVDVDLEHMTINDYAHLDVCIYNYIETKDRRWLYRLAAILYRPKTIRRRIKNFFSEEPIDERMLLIDKKLEKRTEKFINHLPMYYLDAIQFIYLSIQNTLKASYPFVYKKATDEMSETQMVNDYGWSSVIIDMAGNKFGTIKQTSNQPLTDILVVLNRDLEIEEIKKDKRI